MDETAFGLKKRPFPATPDPECFFAASGTERALVGLQRAAERDEGIGLLTAPSGCGKTLVCRRLLEELSGTFRTAFLANPRFDSPAAMLQTILFELDQPYLRMSEQELRLRLIEYLGQGRRRSSGGSELALLVDEGHLLTPSLLEELRLLGDLAEDGRSLVRLTIAGGERLEDLLAKPELSAFGQRIGVRVYLEPFTLQETAAYLDYRLHWAGSEIEGLFPPETAERVHRLSDGTARVINQIADQTLMLAASRDLKSIPPKLVDEAWSSIDGVPSLCTEGASGDEQRSGSSVVEFGSADDEDWDWDAEDEKPQPAGGQSLEASEPEETDLISAGEGPDDPLEETFALAEDPLPNPSPPEAAAEIALAFVEEERVVDPVAVLDARRGRTLKPYLCEDLAEVFAPGGSQYDGRLANEESYDFDPVLEQVRRDGEQERGDTLNEVWGVADSALQANSESATLPLRAAEPDADGDLIVVEGEQVQSAPSAETSSKPRYQKLLAKLRFG